MKTKFLNYPIINILFIIILLNQCNFGNEKYEIFIDSHKIKVELAVTQKQRQKGLMYRETLPENEGLLFVFPEERIQSFWMKNTPIPLDVAFFDSDGYLLEIQSMEPYSEKIHQSSEPAKYALEMNKGWFKKNNIKRYAKLKLSKEVQEKIKELSKKEK
ncbi:MAG: hypothetical protein KatS3mg129_0973 [Leptospiraceae bacterium]|nr:MAG: hypothetical protein KatS3mg129_0973 [Leptospiraceae bacterium]